MKNKYCKLLIILFMSFFVSIFQVNAREVNLEELGDVIDSLVPNADEALIIGEYVFTSEHKINIQDIILAANKSKNGIPSAGDTDYSKMTIYRLKVKYANHERAGWEVTTPFLGTDSIKLDASQKINIRYVDYKYVKELYKVEFELDEGSFKDGKDHIYVEENGKIDRNLITGENAPTREEKRFKEWIKTEDGNGTWDFDSDTVTKNIKLKATWYDEVNTDNLINTAKETINKNTKTNGYYYDVDFKDGVITFNVYDLNKKNSEISNTGLIGDIVNIVNAQNVTSLTISNGTESVEFDDDDVSGGAGPLSPAWQQFALLLCKLTGIEVRDGTDALTKFKNVTLGDLVNIKDKLTLTIKVDDKNARSQNDKIEEQYDIKFAYTSQAEIDKTIPEKGLQELKELNYTPEDTYKIEKNEDGYKISGYITEQKGVKGFGSSPSNYYFAFTLTLNDGINEVNVKLPKGPGDGDEYNVATKSDFTDNKLTLLMEVEEKEVTKYRDIIIEIDGVPTKIRIDFSELKCRKASTFTIDNIDDSSDPFNTPYGWEAKDGYKTTFSKINDNPQKLEVTGLLPIFDNNDWNSDPFNTGYGPYYLGFIIKLDEKLPVSENKDNIIVKFLHGDEEETTDNSSNGKAITSKDFDGSKIMYVLKYINPKDNNKTFEIKVDLDGTDEEYGEYSITINWSKLKFQGDSNSGSDYEPVKENELNEIDKQTLENSWHFDFSKVDVKYSTGMQEETGSYHNGLTGTVKEQTLDPAAGFSEDEGYYVPVKITVPIDDLPAEYHNKWTISLKDSEGNYVEKHPSPTDYENGYIIVLFKMKDGNQGIHYKIDYDGNADKEFLPSEEITINTTFTFLSENKVIFEYFDESTGTVQSEAKIVYQGETIESSIAPSLDSYKYHSLDYWYDKEKGSSVQFAFGSASTNKDEDITLKAHYTLNIDKFLVDVVEDLKNKDSHFSTDFSDIFEVNQDGNTITFKVKDTTTKLSDMNRTSIPGTIAYILQRGEIKDITLFFGDKKVVFTKDASSYEVQTASLDPIGSALKEKIQVGAQALFKKVLGGEEAESNMTLNKMAVENKEFKLIIGSLDDSVKLNDEVTKEYTFKFETDIAPVQNEAELTAALANKSIKKIQIMKSFDVENTLEVNNPVNISSNGDAYTITAKSDKNLTNIFTIKTPSVSMENLKLTGAKEAIVVSNAGGLTFSSLDVSDNTEAGILVKDTSTVSGDKLTMNNENYNLPAIKTPKNDNSVVNLTINDNKKAQKITKEKITPATKGTRGDTKAFDEDYDYYNYYNKEENSKIYKITFQNVEAGSKASFIRYAIYGSNVTPPTDEGEVFASLKKLEYKGHIYNLKGYSLNYNDTKTASGEGTSCEMSASVKEQVNVTGDATYYTAFCVSVKEGAEHVSNADQFEKALAKPEVDEIYINENSTIDLSDKILTINKSMTIIGDKKETSILKVKGINITADEIFFQRLNIQGNSSDYSENGNAIINVNITSGEKAKFTLWDSKVSNIGAGNATYGILISHSTKVIGDIRWNRFEASKIENYVYLNGNVASGTDLYLNTFAKDDAQSSGKNSDVIMKAFDTNAEIRNAANTLSSNKYNLRLESVANNSATIVSQSMKIGVNYSNDSDDFSNITVKTKDPSLVDIKYIKDDTETEELEKGINVIADTQ